MPRNIKEVEAELDTLEAAMLPAALAERERCRVCGKNYDEHSGAWCACPTCEKPFEPRHGCEAGDYVPFSAERPDGRIPF
jgi:nitrous oxide reductase accessory protein NosL